MTYYSYRFFWLTLIASLTGFNSSLSMAMMILVKGEFLIWLMTQRSNVIMGENGWKSEGENQSKVEVPMMGKWMGVKYDPGRWCVSFYALHSFQSVRKQFFVTFTLLGAMSSGFRSRGKRKTVDTSIEYLCEAVFRIGFGLSVLEYPTGATWRYPIRATLCGATI